MLLDLNCLGILLLLVFFALIFPGRHHNRDYSPSVTLSQNTAIRLSVKQLVNSKFNLFYFPGIQFNRIKNKIFINQLTLIDLKIQSSQ